MALIMATTYGYTRQGLRTYAVNRALRLFPSYWAILILTVGAILIFGEDTSRAYRNTIYLPDTPWVWVQNVTMFYVTESAEHPATSVPCDLGAHNELFFYAMIGLGLFRSLRMTWIVVALGLGYQVYIIATAVFELERLPQTFILSGALPFGIGGLLFHYRHPLARFSPGTTITYVIFHSCLRFARGRGGLAS